MAENTSRVRALFEPAAAAVKAYLNWESCESFASRKVKENYALLGMGEISLPQAADYLSMLQQITQSWGDKSCSSIVAKDYDVMLARLALRTTPVAKR
jgi:hypothetical protein